MAQGSNDEPVDFDSRYVVVQWRDEQDAWPEVDFNTSPYEAIGLLRAALRGIETTYAISGDSNGGD